MRCRHCEQRPVSRPRGLCWKCFARRRIRVRYTPAQRRQSETGLKCRNAPLPPLPTAALPGSPQKVLVMMQRAAAHQQLFHPDDASLRRAQRSPCAG